MYENQQFILNQINFEPEKRIEAGKIHVKQFIQLLRNRCKILQKSLSSDCIKNVVQNIQLLIE